MFIYRFRQSDMVFDTAIEVPDGTNAIPPYHTFQAPPEKDGHYAVMQGGWKLYEGDKPADPDLDPANIKAKYNAAQREARSKAYVAESDPLFFKAQRGELTLKEWEDKVAEIKERFPYEV